MFSAILFASLVLTAPEKGIEEIWQGELLTEAVEIHGRKKKAATGKSVGKTHHLTIKIKRKGSKFDGEWIEGHRVLTIRGEVSKYRFKVTDKKIKAGEWKKAVVDDLGIMGEFDKKDPNTLHGQIFGKGGRLERSGVFTVSKKTAESLDE